MDDEKQDVTIDLFTALDMDSDAVTERAPEVENNQKLGLLIGFLSVDDWYHAQVLFDRLSHLNPVEHTRICNGLFRVIEQTMSEAYAVVYQKHLEIIGTAGPDVMESTAGSSIQNSSIDLPREFFQMLSAAGPYLHRDTILLQKVCRVLRAYYLSAQELAGPRAKEAKLRVEEALGKCVLPSLQLIPANPAVGQVVWDVLSLLPYEDRYRLYGEWEKDDERIPMVVAARQIAKLDTRRILKRLAKENLKQLGRMVAKLAHANPMTVLRTIVHQIEAYRDMIIPVVDAFKYLRQLEYDVLEYVVIERLAQGGREKLKDDGLNLSDWLQSLASFWGHLCKKYPSMELRGLFQYLVNQLKKGSGIELVLLQELIQQMANVQYTENMTEEQLDATAGSETLRYQATLFGMTRNNKALSKSTNRLRDSLLPKEEPKLAIPLLLLIAQHRSMVIINAEAPHIKMVSEQFDRCHGTLLQYVEFLLSAVAPSTTYAQLIPSLDDLVHKYHLDPEVAFLVYRPVMRLFKGVSGAEICWPLDITEDSNIQSANNEAEPTTLSSDVVLDLGSPWKPVKWSDLLDTVWSMLPPKAWNSLSPDLYATFWGLTLYDLYVPRHRYESEIAKQHAAIKGLEELSDNSSIAITKRKKDKERIQELLDRLISEFQEHEQHVASVHQRLSHEKDKWLSSCPDTLKINMEFLQRCIFPRCIFSMQDAVYCAMFVHTLHSLGTPFFNTVNHIDVLICKTLQPMICCCTEFEAGRLGRFLYETLKMAYHWKSDETIYERECGNMPGFAVYYRYPNSQRVTYSQFIRVHWKWSGRITRLLVQCLESTEYMEIRNALIVLTKISSVFPVTRKSGINLEKRVAKIKGDEREDLKVLATGVAAALAARKSSWVSEEEFGMGHIDLKPAASPAKSLAGNQGNASNGSALSISHNEMTGMRNATTGNQLADPLNTAKDQVARAKSTDGRLDRSESGMLLKSDSAQQKPRSGSSTNGPDSQTLSSSLPPKPSAIVKNPDELAKVSPEETAAKVTSKGAVESETRPQQKRAAQNSLGRLPRQEAVKEDAKSGKSISRAANQQSSATADKDLSAHQSESRQLGSAINSSSTSNGNLISASGKVAISSSKMNDVHASLSKMDSGSIKSLDDNTEVSDAFPKQQKRTVPTEEQDRLNKRRRGETEGKDGEAMEVRMSDKERTFDPRSVDKSYFSDHDRPTIDEQNLSRPMDKLSDKSKEKTIERYDKDHREKLDRPEKSRGEDILEKSRDRSIERHGREHSVERVQERVADRTIDRSVDKSRDDRSKDDRNKPRHNEVAVDKVHPDERFHGQGLPPPPPLPPSFVPQSVGGSRRDEEPDRRVNNARHVQRLSPRHDEKERRRSEENVLASQDDAKRRRDDDFRERKREERDVVSNKAEERDRDKGNILKDDVDSTAASKRRKLKRDHTSSSEAGGEYSPVIPPPPPLLATGMSQSFDSRERGDRKGMGQHRAVYADEVPRMHGKEAASKINRRETDQLHEREWEEDKRRTDAKKKHRK
ncbi:THO complex subunit 2 isoform X2 [Elaeis guineensis]